MKVNKVRKYANTNIRNEKYVMKVKHVKEIWNKTLLRARIAI